MAIIPQVYRATIFFGNIEVDAYSDTPSGKGGKHRNFLSGQSMAESIGLHNSTVMSERLPKELKAALGSNFKVVLSWHKMESGGLVRVNLWDIESAMKYYFYHAGKKNQSAIAIVNALCLAALNRVTDDRFDRELSKRGELQACVNSHILAERHPWEAVYSPEFLSWVRENFYPRDFFWTYIYCFLTPQEREGLKQVSPWKAQTLQYLNQKTLDRLEDTVRTVHALAITSTSAQDFETRYHRCFGFDRNGLD